MPDCFINGIHDSHGLEEIERFGFTEWVNDTTQIE